tara:strand:- start:4375 stop:4677 length:303 start_codon:yes stop_codon:yes gene_type:complete
METTTTKPSPIQQNLKIALIVLVACFALFSLDKDVHTPSDLFEWGNFFALILYFTPTFLLSIFLFKYVSKKLHPSDSFLLALLIGIPFGFILVISLLRAL